MPWEAQVGRRLKLRDLDILITVAQCGSMGKAAEQLAISQPVVSKAIADMERAVGVRLLDRSPRGVEPTPHGHALIRRGQFAFNELRQGIRDIEFLSDPTVGELRIGATVPVATAIIAPVVDRLSRKYPRMTFHIVAEDTDALYRELAARNIELVVARISAPLSEDMEVEILFHDTLVIVAAANNPLTRRRNIELADLLKERWAMLPRESHFGSLVTEAFRALGQSVPRFTVTTSSHYMRDELMRTGRYLTIVPGFAVRFPRRNPSFKELPVEIPHARLPVAITTLKNRSLSPLAQLFADEVRASTRTLADGK